MTGPALRPAIGGDAEGIALLHAKAFADAWATSAIASLIDAEGGDSLVAQKEGRIVGFLLGRHAADEAEILSIAVAADHRRSGLGARMLTRFVERSAVRGVAAVFIEVAEADAGAVAFYRATGFEVCGRRRGYYRDRPDGEGDALLMRLDIAASVPA